MADMVIRLAKAKRETAANSRTASSCSAAASASALSDAARRHRRVSRAAHRRPRRRDAAQLDEQLRARGLFFGDRALCSVLRPRFLSPAQYRFLQQRAAVVLRAFRKAHRAALADDALLDAIPAVSTGSASSRTSIPAFAMRVPSRASTRSSSPKPAGCGSPNTTPRRRRAARTTTCSPKCSSAFRSCASSCARGICARCRRATTCCTRCSTPTRSGRARRDRAAHRDRRLVRRADAERVRALPGLLHAAGLRVRRSSIRAERRRTTASDSAATHGDDRPDLQARAAARSSWSAAESIIRFCARCGTRTVCMVNPPSCKILHKKASLAVLHDERNASLFDADEREAIAASIPWTRVVEERKTTHDGDDVDLLPFIADHREQLVLKPNDEYGGKGIVLGWEVDDADVAARRSRPRSPSRTSCSSGSRCRRSRIRASSTARCMFADRMVDTAPYVAYGDHVDGCLTRLAHGVVAQRDRRRRKSDANVHRRTAAASHEGAIPHARHRRRVSDHRSRDARAQVVHHRDSRPATHMILDEVKPELHQSMVEIGSKVCRTPPELRDELVRLRGLVMDLAGEERPRHRRGGHASVLVVDDAGDHAARALRRREGRSAGPRAAAADLRHAHSRRHRRSGIPHRRDERRALSAAARAVSVDELAVLAGATHRTEVVPQHRLPELSAHRRSADPALVRASTTSCSARSSTTGCVPDGSKIWWDVRPHHAYPTLEFRVCDVCTRVEEAVCIAAILQAIVAKIWKLRRDNLTFRVYPSAMIEENKWRAVRFGLDGKLIDFGKETGAARARVDRRDACSGSWTTSWTSWAAGAKSSTRSRSCGTARAPTASSPCSTRPAT